MAESREPDEGRPLFGDEARLGYLYSVRRLSMAIAAFNRSAFPMDPGPGAEPRPWSRHDVAVITEIAAAFAEVIRWRRAWDRARRGRRAGREPPDAGPHSTRRRA